MSAQRKERVCSCKGCTTGKRECDRWYVRNELPVPYCDCGTCDDARAEVKAAGGQAKFLEHRRIEKLLSRGLSGSKYKNKRVKLAISANGNNVIEFPGKCLPVYGS